MFASIVGGAEGGSEPRVKSIVRLASSATEAIQSVLDMSAGGLSLSIDLGLEYRVRLSDPVGGGQESKRVSLFPSKQHWAGCPHGAPDSGFAGNLQDKGWPDAFIETYSLFGTEQGVCVSGSYGL